MSFKSPKDCSGCFRTEESNEGLGTAAPATLTLMRHIMLSLDNELEPTGLTLQSEGRKMLTLECACPEVIGSQATWEYLG